MHGKPRPRPPSRLSRLLLALAALLLSLPAPAAGRELRRQMPFLRPLLMGDAYVAVGDEASSLLYNPAGLGRVADGSLELFSFQFSADRTLTNLLIDPESVQAEYEGLEVNELEDIVGTSLYYDVTLKAPVLYLAGAGSAYGFGFEQLTSIEVVSVPIDLFGLVQEELPGLAVEIFADALVFASFFGKAGNLAVGMTIKGIARTGIDKTIDALTLFQAGVGLDLEQDPEFAAVVAGEVRQAVGLDLGLIYELPGFPVWRPRFGLSILNIGGYETGRGYRGFHGIEFGQKPDEDTPPLFGELPLNVSAGFAISPTFDAIRYTFALDLVDLTETALEGDSLSNRLRAGFEVGIGPHEDGTALFSLLFGWNASHFSVGILSRVWIFEIGFGRYTVEKGARPGEDPDERRVLLISVRI